MQANFPHCLAIIRREEGGNDDDPRDHGGRTSRGITQSEWNSWRQVHPDKNLPEDVWAAPNEEVDAVYKIQYWDPYGDHLPSGIDLMFFNICVNAGRQQAVKLLQRAVGVTDDGMMGVQNLGEVNSLPPRAVIQNYSEKIEIFYRHLRQFKTYGNGWLGRLKRVTIEAQAMAPATPTVPQISINAPAAKKADPTDVAQPPILDVTSATSTSAGSAVLSGISDQLQQASAAFQPLSEALVWAKYICLGITVICAGLAIYAIIHHRRVQAAV